jgi:hypothetical protein
MDWLSYGLGFGSGLALKVIGEILSPTLAELGVKLHAKVQRKPYIRGQLAEELRTLESIIQPLLYINQIPRFPDSYKETAEWLMDIDTSARKLRMKAFQGIKDKLIEFASPMDQIGTNTSFQYVLTLFVKDDKSIKLVQEIRELILKVTKEKGKKKK